MPELRDIIDSVINESETAEQIETPADVNDDPSTIENETEEIVEDTEDGEVQETEVIPEVPAKKLPDAIPYERFQEVIAERNNYQQIINQLIENQKTQSQKPVELIPDPEPEIEEIPEFESAMEEKLYHMILETRNELKAKDEIINSLKSNYETQTEQQAAQAAELEFNSTLTELGGEYSEEEKGLLVQEAMKFENVPDITIRDAVQRAYYYLTGTGQIANKTVSTPKPNPIKQITDNKQKLVNTAPKSASPGPANKTLENINSIRDAIEFAMAYHADDK